MKNPGVLRNPGRAASAIALALAMGSFSAATVTAGTILDVSTGGTFASGTPSSSWTGAGDTWTFSFLVNSTPSITSYSTGTNFDLPFSNFVYTLNGSPVSVGAVDVVFYSSGDEGLFNICFFGCNAADEPTNGFEFQGAQAYSGSESAPTILPGPYAETYNSVDVSSTGQVQVNGTVNISSIPEPDPAGLSATGLLMLAAVIFLRKKDVRGRANPGLPPEGIAGCVSYLPELSTGICPHGGYVQLMN